jgi:hypothetical protein
MDMNQQKKKSFNIVNSNASGYMVDPSTTLLHSSGTLNFTLHPATGGYILQFSTYDITKDERQSKLHIITTDQDLGERIGQIISFELLRS